MNEGKKIGGLIGFGILVVLVLIVALSSYSIVPIGSRGIKTRLGNLVGELGTGPRFKTPFLESIVKMDVQTQKEQVDVEAASSDLQDVHTVVALNYNVMPDKVTDLYVNVGTDYKTRIIDPAIQEAVKASTAKYTANDLIQNRPAVRDAIQKDLTAKLAENFLQVTDVSIVDFKFSTSFNQAIENKVTAEQNALAAKNKLEQATYEAQAIKITSEAANNEKYIQLQTLEVQKAAVNKWNGILPTQMIPGASLPFINVGK